MKAIQINTNRNKYINIHGRSAYPCGSLVNQRCEYECNLLVPVWRQEVNGSVFDSHEKCVYVMTSGGPVDRLIVQCGKN